MEVVVAAGVDAFKRVNTNEDLLSHHVIARPDANVESVIPIHYTKAVEQFLYK